MVRNRTTFADGQAQCVRKLDVVTSQWHQVDTVRFPTNVSGHIDQSFNPRANCISIGRRYPARLQVRLRWAAGPVTCGHYAALDDETAVTRVDFFPTDQAAREELSSEIEKVGLLGLIDGKDTVSATVH